MNFLIRGNSSDYTPLVSRSSITRGDIVASRVRILKIFRLRRAFGTPKTPFLDVLERSFCHFSTFFITKIQNQIESKFVSILRKLAPNKRPKIGFQMKNCSFVLIFCFTNACEIETFKNTAGLQITTPPQRRSFSEINLLIEFENLNLGGSVFFCIRMQDFLKNLAWGNLDQEYSHRRFSKNIAWREKTYQKF